MEYLNAYIWPNYRNRNELARHFFEKAKAGIDTLNLDNNCALCLCYRSSPMDMFIVILVESSTPKDDSGILYEKLRSYFDACGCPRYQESASLSMGPGTTVDNLAERMVRSGFTIIEGPVIKRVADKTEPLQAQEASKQSGNLPWDSSAKAPEDAEEFLQSLRDSLPGIFQAVGNRGSDPVVMLVDIGDIRWRGLLGLLHTYHGQPYFSPETVTGQKPQVEQDAHGPFYRAPTIGGKQLRVGVYAVEREWLVSELCAISGLPIPFIKQVQRAQTPKGMFTIVYFLKTHLGVRHMSPDASVCEAPHLSLADLM